jgi:serine protease AprX
VSLAHSTFVNINLEKKMRIVSILTILVFPILLSAQYNDDLGYYWVTFTEKSDTAYTIENPFTYLSQKAIERRIRHQIPFDEQDLPVNRNFIQQLQQMGAEIHNTSRWFNAATIVFEKEKIAEIEELEFVNGTEYVGRYIIRKPHAPSNYQPDTLNSSLLLNVYHGFAAPQTRMINADALHQMGFRGEGIHVGVADGGFINIDKMPFMAETLLAHNRDFVEKDNEVLESSSHGSKVLALMAANLPGYFVGTAPGATFTCMKTEDTRGEYRLEECNWIAALEYSDSLGLDVVNTSLGYSTFNDQQMDYTYDQLDGETAVSSKAAKTAYEKGMILIVSAGNEGNGSWKHVNVPADSKYVLSIGATDLAGQKAGFSSFGPTADGRVKPDVSAPGSSIVVPAINGYKISFGSGTSFAAPITAGAVACLWQAFPAKSNKEIMEAVKASANQYDNPDNELGYGIPDFMKAYEILKGGKERVVRP